jgi:hypothetical protein
MVTALVVLFLQMGGALASATALCCATAAAALSADDDVCCQGLAPGQICPLHKHGKGGHKESHRSPSSGGCAMRSGCGTQPAGLESLSFGLGTLPAPDSIIDRPLGCDFVCAASSIATRSLLPDLPPPRV